MKTAVVSGAFGFAGANLVERLLDDDYVVYAIGRNGSTHNDRFKASKRLKIRFMNMDEYDNVASELDSEDVCGKDVETKESYRMPDHS